MSVAIDPLFHAAVSQNYVKITIKQSKPKSCIVKQWADVLARPLTQLINTSLSSGVFPTSLKKGVIRPSIKRQALDFDVYSSYRPITNVVPLQNRRMSSNHSNN